MNVISDGIGDAFLVDLMVHPDHQHHGLATALVAKAIEELNRESQNDIAVPTVDRFECLHSEYCRTHRNGIKREHSMMK